MTVELGLTGRILEDVQFGHAITLRFTEQHEALIEERIQLTVGAERVDVPADAEWSEPVSALAGRRVRTAGTLESGALHIAFEGDAELLVEPSTDYESWTVTGPGGMRVVCLAGGELAVWSAREISYFGSVPPGRTRDRPGGVFRRTVVDGQPVDEAFTRNLRWEPTSALRERDLGFGDIDFIEITPAEAEAFVLRVTDKLRT